MYSDFYHLKEEPFHITPDPKFLFLAPSHREALGSIIYGVEKGKGFILITGQIGVGKTTMLRSYLQQVNNKRLKVIPIFNSNVAFKGLLKTINLELGLPIKTEDVFDMVNHLHEAMINEYKEGRNVVLIIDEAQNMPVETLENLRMLSNLETSTDKLIQIVLVAQPEFERILDLDQLRQLRQRIAIRTTIVPFSEPESVAYVKYRLEKVALDDTPVFTKGALRTIVKQAKGIPRILNILCDNSLITGFGYKKIPVDTKIVKEVISDFEGRPKRSLLRWVLAPAALLLFVASLYFIYFSIDLVLSKPESPAVSKTSEESEPREVIKSPVEKEALSRIEEGIPAEESISGETKNEPSFPVTQVVEKGDNLLALTRKIYGYTDDKVLEKIREKNPRIKDVNRILIGEEIVFPELEKGE